MTQTMCLALAGFLIREARSSKQTDPKHVWEKVYDVAVGRGWLAGKSIPAEGSTGNCTVNRGLFHVEVQIILTTRINQLSNGHWQISTNLCLFK